MKLTKLYESHALASSSCDFYCDPKLKKKLKKKTKDMSFLVGGDKDRKKFISKMNGSKQ